MWEDCRPPDLRPNEEKDRDGNADTDCRDHQHRVMPERERLRHQRRRVNTVHDLQGTQDNVEGVGAGRPSPQIRTGNGSITRQRRSSAAP